MNRNTTYSISLSQLECMAQLISDLDDDGLTADERIAKASEAHAIVADVLGPDENLIYPEEVAA